MLHSAVLRGQAKQAIKSNAFKEEGNFLKQYANVIAYNLFQMNSVPHLLPDFV